MNEKFEVFCKRFNIDPVSPDGDLANVFFNLGLKTALKEQTSVPALLVSSADQEIDFQFVQFVHDPDDLTQADMQSMSSLLNKILNSFHEGIDTCTRGIRFFWERSTPGYPSRSESDQMFKQLNLWKANREELRSQVKKYAALQRKLKILMKIA